jgi:hypothetical protein
MRLLVSSVLATAAFSLAACSLDATQSTAGAAQSSAQKLASKPATTAAADTTADSNLGPVPTDVQSFLDQNSWGTMHLRWHTVRQWDRLSQSALDSATAQGWSRAAIQEGQPGNGLQFLAMHRVMFRQLKAQFPQYVDTTFKGWASVPTDPSDPLNTLPNGDTTPFSADMSTAIANLTTNPGMFDSDDAWGVYLETTVRPTADDPNAQSPDTTTGLHNYLHNRFSDDSSPITMGDPSVNMGNKMFWKLHGWIDEQWTNFRAAKGLTESDAAYVQALSDATNEMSTGGMNMGGGTVDSGTDGSGGMDMGGMTGMISRHTFGFGDLAPIRAHFRQQRLLAK